MKFGEIVKKAREELGLSQKEVAEDCGINPCLFGDYEKGKFTPALENALKLSKYLGISLDDLKHTIPIPADRPRPKLVRPKQPH